MEQPPMNASKEKELEALRSSAEGGFVLKRWMRKTRPMYDENMNCTEAVACDNSPPEKNMTGNNERSSEVDFFGQPIRSPYLYSLKTDIYEFMDTTTIHALGNIARHNSIPLRIFITLCLLASLGACTWQIVVAVVNYLSYEIITTSSTQFEAPTEFPMVTFCNLNPYNQVKANSYIQQYVDNGEVEKQSFSTSIEYVARMTDYLLYQLIRNNSLTSQAYTQTCGDIIGNEDGLSYYSYNISSDVNMTCDSGNPGSGYSNKDLGFDISQMLISCQYQNEECTAADFIYYYDYYYGNCYRFNSGKNSTGEDESIKYSGKPGWKYGLQLELYAGDAYSQEAYSVNRGFRIVVLNRTFTQQMIQDFGVDVSVGQTTSVAVRRSFTNHMGYPYGNCLDNDIANIDWNQNDVLKFMNNYFVKGNTYSNGNWTWEWDVKYSQYICVNMCYQKYLLDTCDCFDVTLPKSENVSTMILNKACSSTASLKCRLDASNNFYESADLTGDCYNKCPIECQEQKYVLSTSVSQYPTRWYAKLLNQNPSFSATINYEMDGTVNYTDNYESLRDSIAHIYVYYEDMLYNQIDESPATTLLDLISYLGGLTGLFLGASLLSLIEPLVVVYNLLYNKISIVTSNCISQSSNEARNNVNRDIEMSNDSRIYADQYKN